MVLHLIIQYKKVSETGIKRKNRGIKKPLNSLKIKRFRRIWKNFDEVLSDPLGIRTQDPILKRDVLYLLS
jgi:hypothetical protein